MNTDQILEELLEFLSSNFLVERDDIDLDRSLVDQGVIDSLGLTEISAHLGRAHGVKVEPSEMNQQNFGSVRRIVDFVLRKSAT